MMYNYIYLHTAYSHKYIHTYNILKMGNSKEITLVVPPYLINKRSVSSIWCDHLNTGR